MVRLVVGLVLAAVATTDSLSAQALQIRWPDGVTLAFGGQNVAISVDPGPNSMPVQVWVLRLDGTALQPQARAVKITSGNGFVVSLFEPAARADLAGLVLSRGGVLSARSIPHDTPMD